MVMTVANLMGMILGVRKEHNLALHTVLLMVHSLAGRTVAYLALLMVLVSVTYLVNLMV